MSLVGPLAGALAAAGIYYGFSSLIRESTERHTADLKRISHRLIEAPDRIAAPPPASARIARRPFTDMMQAQWNSQVEALFRETRRLDEGVVKWGKNLVHGK